MRLSFLAVFLGLGGCIPHIPQEDAGAPPPVRAPPRCGDGVVDPGEACDGDDTAGATCVGRGFSGGALACDATCALDDASCTRPPATCGQGARDDGEACDGLDFGAATCASLGLGGGELRCTAGCTLDAAGCDVQPVCGDGAVDPGEGCDPPAPARCNADCQLVAEQGHCGDHVDNDGDGEMDCGDADCAADDGCRGKPVVLGPGNDQDLDVSKDGAELSWVTEAGELFVVRLDAATAAVQMAVGVDNAAYHGNSLLIFHGVTGELANTADVKALGDDVVRPLGAHVLVNTASASPNDVHLYFEESIGGGLEDLFLDGVKFLHGAKKEKARYTADNRFLVVGANIADDSGTILAKVVQTFSLDGGASVVLAADGASNQTQTSREGSRVLFGANENGNVVDLIAAAADGSGPRIELAHGADDAGYKVTLDDSEVVYIVDSVASGAIEAVRFDGSERRTILAGGAVRLEDISATHLMFSTSIDPSTGFSTLKLIGLDGAGITALGTGAEAKGFTADGRFAVYREGETIESVNNDLHDIGALRAFDTVDGTVHLLADRVRKVSFATANLVVFLDENEALSVADLAAGKTTALAAGVKQFKLVHDTLDGPASRVAFSTVDGVFLRDLE